MGTAVLTGKEGKMLAKKKWIELLEQKKLEITEKLTEAYIDAFNTRKCIAVELFDDGRVEFAFFPDEASIRQHDFSTVHTSGKTEETRFSA